VGAGLLHVWLAWHIVDALPLSMKPELHAYVAVEPKVSAGALTVPFVGAVSAGQLTGTHVGPVLLNVPFAWQVALVLPIAMYPLSQVNVTLLPNVALGALTVPCDGAIAPLHVIGAHVGAVPLNDMFA
jgi:hypothetical protein